MSSGNRLPAGMRRIGAGWTDVRRLGHVSWVATRHLWLWKGPRLLPGQWSVNEDPDRPDDGPDRLRRMFEEMGGIFVKLGQLLALQPDVLPAAYCNALYGLLDRVSPFCFDRVCQILEQELGSPPDEVFSFLDPEPLATASVGQVHVARLGELKVAVKVQRPEAGDQFGSDLRILIGLLGILRRLPLRRWLWLVKALEELIEWTREELDYRQEARYTEHLYRLADDNPAQRAPRVMTHLTTRRVLVTEFLDGTVLLQYLRAQEKGAELDALKPRGFDRKRFATNVIDNFLLDAFGNGVYHADLHPANLLMLDHNVVGYIDFGITGVMSAHGRRHLIFMTWALAVGDMGLFYQHYMQLATFGSRSDPQAFRRGLDELGEQWYDPEVTRSNPDETALRVNFTRIMVDLLALARRNHLLPERDIVRYMRSTIAIDGLVTRFHPDFHVGSYLAQRCEEYLTQRRRLERLAPDRWLDWAASQGRLWREGPELLSRWLERPEHDALAWGPPTDAPRGGLSIFNGPAKVEGQEGRRALLFGVFALALALLLALGDGVSANSASAGSASSGMLWRTELALLVLTVTLLVIDISRLALGTRASRRTPS